MRSLAYRRKGESTIPLDDIPCFNIEARRSNYWYDLLGPEDEVATPLAFMDAVMPGEASPPAGITAQEFLEE